MWFKEFNRYHYQIENFAYKEIDEQSFSKPHLQYCRCIKNTEMLVHILWY